MTNRLPKISYRPTKILGVCILALGAVLYLNHQHSVALEDSTKNYSLLYSTPRGWLAIPHSPQAIFLYRNPETHLLMRAAMSDVEADYNPSPDLDTDGTARQILDVTHTNLNGWEGQMLEEIDGKGIKFRLVRRSCPVKIVYSAIGVRGNTTVVVSLSADKQEMGSIERAVPAFRQYLTTLGFRRHIWTD